MNNFKLEKYGKLSLKYLKENKKVLYTQLLIENKLQEHLTNIYIIANKRFELLMKQFMEQENITEKLKSTNQLEWVSKMNNIKKLAEEIILNELIYV